MDWKTHTEDLLKAGATIPELASLMEVTDNAVRELLAGRTKSPRGIAAVRLAQLRPEQFQKQHDT